jgi:hypothetical protein
MKTFTVFLSELAIKLPRASDSLGVPRIAMPQIKTTDYSELFRFMENNNIGHKKIKVRPSELRPVQKEFMDSGVVKALHLSVGEKPILISDDMYVIDGNHRWLAAMNSRSPLVAIQFSENIFQCLAVIKRFPKVTYKGLYK